MVHLMTPRSIQSKLQALPDHRQMRDEGRLMEKIKGGLRGLNRYTVINILLLPIQEQKTA